MPLVTLKRRSEFLRVRGGARWATPAFVLETRAREPAQSGPRFGFTVTKKLGKAVARNRIRRRLRAALTETAAAGARDGHDYVIVARAAALDRDFAQLRADFAVAFARVHADRAVRGAGRDRTAKRS